MANPLEQFEIKTLVPVEIGGVDISITNSTVAMAAAVAIGAGYLIVGAGRAQAVPGRLQSLAEMTYEFVANLIRDAIGTEGRRFFPLIFSIFIFILLGNMLGLLPYSFTFTSHIAVTFAMAILIFLGVTILGFATHGLRFITFFAPPGVPKAMLLLLVPIEILSYLARPITLSVRLAANMIAGHTLLKIIGGFTFGLGAITFGIGGILPVALDTALIGLELVIAFLQAYVFAILTALYINDALHMH